MRKSIFLIHGRGPTPPRQELSEVCWEALRFGIGRNQPAKLARFEVVAKELIYYGDLSNEFLKTAGVKRCPASSIQQYKTTLRQLEALADNSLFRPEGYSHLRGRPRWTAIWVRLLAFLGAVTHLGTVCLGRVYRDIAAYWDPTSEFHQAILGRLEPVRRALRRGDDVLLLSHSLGTVIAWDFLAEVSRAATCGEDGPVTQIDTWVTLGSPLGDPNFQRRTLHWCNTPRTRLRTVVGRWFNISAEGDHCAIDRTLSDDYHELVRSRQIAEIEDIRLGNPALRDNRPHPHSLIGYLISPQLADIVGPWV